MERIVVVGSTGSGKTTLARALAKRRGVSHVELDALHWDPGWTEAPRDVFRERAASALSPDSRWVVDGNYRVVRDIVWSRADTLVWLDYPLWLVFWRLTRRTLWRGITRAELYNGNRESLWTHLFTRDSLFLWLWKTYGLRRREYPMLLARPEFAHLSVKRFRRPGEARVWLERLPHRAAGVRGGERPG
jgi:adenylate kinase family enzyme